jgi:hypothetical protein
METRFQLVVGAAYHPAVPGGAEVLSDDSPLHRLPSSLDRQQVLFLDGISFSVYMTSIGYQRLQALLYEETLAEQPTHVRQALIVDAFAAIPEGATDYIARLDLPVD